MLCAVVTAQVDQNGNGVSDLWEDLFQPIPQPLSADTDGDGLRNGEEATAGTNPNSAGSHLNLFTRYHNIPGEESRMRIGWYSVPGKRYYLQYATPDDSVFRNMAGPFYGSGEPMYTWLNNYPFSFGGVHAELWRNKPGDVSQPADLRTTATPPDITIGLPMLSLAEGVPGDYAALRINGEFRSRVASGDYRFRLASAGASAFYFNATGVGTGANLQQNVTNQQIAPVLQGPANDLQAWKRHSIQLVYLPANPATAQFKVTVREDTATPAPSYVPEGAGLIPWRDVDRSLLPLLNEPCLSFRVCADDYDPDADGVNTWEELNLGLSPFDPTTTGSTPDMSRAINLIHGGNVLELVINNTPPTLIEELGGSATLTIQRVSGNEAITIPLVLSGVDASDLTGLPASLSLPVGQSSASFTVSAANDGKLEPLEVATITVNAPGNVIITGDDHWLTILEDELDPQPILYAGRYVRENGPTEAWGYTTLLLSPDRRSALISSQFSNLTTPQTVAHIHRGAAGVSGPIVEGLPIGTYNEHVWQIGTAVDMNMPGMVMADPDLQRALDDLVAGRLYANVHSTLNPAGEIRANYSLSDGVFDFVPPSPLPPVAGGPNPSDLDAFRFLEQATFGPDAASITAVKALGIKTWLTRQMNPATTPPTSFVNFVNAADTYDDRLSGKDFGTAQGDHRRNLRGAWWSSAVHGKDQLRKRVTFALSEIFVTSTEVSTLANRTEGMASYYDMLSDNAFGNFRTLLEDVSYHPVMGIYLSHLKNAKEDPVAGTKPDENYAREIMQLFSIGLFEKHPDGTLRLDAAGQLVPTYNNEDITELAKVFTGLSFSKKHNNAPPAYENDFFNYYGGPGDFQDPYMTRMNMFPNFHELGPKTLFGNSDNPGYPINLPANQTGDNDIADALDALFEHPNTPSFISRLLIQRLVTSNPSRGYVYRVANAFRNNGQGVRGDLAAVIEAIYLDQEARLASSYNEPGYGKLKEPLIRLAAVMRAFGVSNAIPLSELDQDGLQLNRYEGGAIRIPFSIFVSDPKLGQTPMNAPSVFNWYLPDFVPGGTFAQAQLVGPEFQTTTDSMIMQRLNLFNSLVWYDNGYSIVGTFVNRNNANDDNLIIGHAALAGLSVPDLVDHLDAVLLGGRMTSGMRNTLLADLPAITSRRTQAAIHFVINSPLYVAQR